MKLFSFYCVILMFIAHLMMTVSINVEDRNSKKIVAYDPTLQTKSNSNEPVVLKDVTSAKHRRLAHGGIGKIVPAQPNAKSVPIKIHTVVRA